MAIEDIRTSGYSVWTEYVNRPEGTAEEQEAIYHVNNIVTVRRFAILDNLGAILDEPLRPGRTPFKASRLPSRTKQS